MLSDDLKPLAYMILGGLIVLTIVALSFAIFGW